MSEVKLKPCPFCGGEAEMLPIRISREKSVEVWNRRTPGIPNRIGQHYLHAKEKHPYFADRMYEERDIDTAKRSLKTWRTRIRDEIESGNRCAETLLNCELCEVAEAYFSGDKAKAVEECYDAIAVILRMVDVLEGRQTLGNPEKKGDAK